MTVKPLPENYLEFLSFEKVSQACLRLHLSKCHFDGTHMSWLIFLMHISVCVIVISTMAKFKHYFTILKIDLIVWYFSYIWIFIDLI